MAHSGDMDLILDKEDTLVSFYKRNPQTNASSGVLLTPEQVAKCVKFFWLEATEVDGIPDIKLTPYAQEVRGLKVNVIGGATGAGKTSLIRIMAGGMETPPKSASDTKCPCPHSNYYKYFWPGGCMRANRSKYFWLGGCPLANCSKYFWPGRCMRANSSKYFWLGGSPHTNSSKYLLV